MSQHIRIAASLLLSIFSGYIIAAEESSEIAQQVAEAQAEALEAAKEAQADALEAQKDAIEAAREAQEDAIEAANEAHASALEKQGEAIGLAAEKMAANIIHGIGTKVPQYMNGGMFFNSVSAGNNPSVLIIPGQKPGSENLRDIREDMRIMSRIWEDIINPDTQSKSWFSMQMVGGLFNTSSAISGIFIQNYGAVFLQQVDFPLIPTEQVKAEEPSKETSSDEVWTKTKKKLKGENVEDESENKEVIAYDAEKVNALKEKCIKTFRHANNIRNLAGQDWVVLIIRYTPEDPETSSAEYDGETTETPDLSSILMIRAAKRDIDAFSKNPDSLEQFKKTVQVLTY